MQKRRTTIDRVHTERAQEFEDERVYADYQGGGNGRGIWYLAGLTILVLAFALTFIFARAQVSVTPREGTVELSGPIVAQKESATGLNYQMISSEADASTTVASSGKTTHIEKKATGTVKIYNNHSTAAQKLLIDTRLETSKGLIYKTKKAVTVPGQKTEGGKLVPGSVEVEIYADEAGEEYNAESAEMKIFGFKGGPKYNNFSAKTTSAISGGFKGESAGIGEEEMASQKDVLKSKLSEDLVSKARASLPDDFIMYDKAVILSFDEPKVIAGEAGNATISMHGKITAVIFKEKDLTRALVFKVVASTDLEKVHIPNIRDLNISLDMAGIEDIESIEDVKLMVDDKINVVWGIDESAIQETLIGSKKRDFDQKMAEFKNIDSAELKLTPMWRSTLPDKVSAIKIINTLDTQD
jgi:hypothetical protein